MHRTQERAEAGMRDRIRELTGCELSPVKAPSELDVADLVEELVVSRARNLEIEAIPGALQTPVLAEAYNFNLGRVKEPRNALTLLGQEEIVKTIEGQVVGARESESF